MGLRNKASQLCLKSEEKEYLKLCKEYRNFDEIMFKEKQEKEKEK